MASVEINLTCNLQTPVKVQYIDGNMFSLDNAGNTINVLVFNGEEPAELGGSVAVSVIRSDGATVAVSGAISGNKAYAILPQSCYAVPGVVSVVIKNVQNTTITTLAAFVANVYQTSTETTVDPGTIIPSVSALIAQIESAVGSIPADYSALLATIAADYSPSKAYPTVGTYAWCNGVLRRSIVPIPTAETYNAAHWTDAVIGDDLSNLKIAFDDVTGELNANSFCALNEFFSENGLAAGYFNQSGEVVSSANYKHTQPMYIRGIDKLTYSGFASLGTDPGAVWLDQNKEFIRYFKPSTNGTYTVAVPSDAYYLATSVHKNDVADVTIKGVLPSTKLLDNISKISNVNNVLAINGGIVLTTNDLEIGGISFSSSGWTYASNNQRVRTKEGFTISVKKYDVITIGSGYSCIVGIHRTDGTYVYSGANTNSYTVPYDGELVFVVYKTTEEVVTDIGTYINNISITREQNAVSKSDFVYPYFVQDTPRSALTVGFVYYSYGNVVETTTSGYYKTPLIPVRAGSTIILGAVTSISYQYAILFDANENVIKSVPALDTDKMHTDVAINIPQNCAYIRFSIKSSQLSKYGLTYTFDRYYTNVLHRKPIISFIDDDTSSVSYVTRYYNALNNAGVKGNFAVQTIELTNQAGLTDLLLDYEEKGFGMLYHCHQQIPAYNSGSTRDIVSAEADFVQGLREMKDAGFCNYKYWITPYGVYDANIQAIARRHGMELLASSANWAYNLPQYGDKYKILRADLAKDDTGTHTLSDLEELIDEAYSNNAWIIVTTHFNTWSDISADSRLTTIANYALTKGFEVMTIPQAWSYYSTAYNMYETLY